MIIAFYDMLSIVSSVITFKSWVDIIPLISAICYTLTIIQEKEKKIRIINLTGLVLWIPYYFAFQAWAHLATCLIISISNIISIVRYDMKPKLKD